MQNTNEKYSRSSQQITDTLIKRKKIDIGRDRNSSQSIL